MFRTMALKQTLMSEVTKVFWSTTLFIPVHICFVFIPVFRDLSSGVAAILMNFLFSSKGWADPCHYSTAFHRRCCHYCRGLSVPQEVFLQESSVQNDE
jgi:hypothetical protein